MRRVVRLYTGRSVATRQPTHQEIEQPGYGHNRRDRGGDAAELLDRVANGHVGGAWQALCAAAWRLRSHPFSPVRVGNVRRAAWFSPRLACWPPCMAGTCI